MDQPDFKKAFEGRDQDLLDTKISCYLCGETERLDARDHDYGVTRSCLICGNRWEGGGGVGREADLSIGERPSVPGVPAQDDPFEFPDYKFTGAAHRIILNEDEDY